jgi:hypothetical protein
MTYLPPLIDFAHVGELLEEVVRDQNSPNYPSTIGGGANK